MVFFLVKLSIAWTTLRNPVLRSVVSWDFRLTEMAIIPAIFFPLLPSMPRALTQEFFCTMAILSRLNYY